MVSSLPCYKGKYVNGSFVNDMTHEIKWWKVSKPVFWFSADVTRRPRSRSISCFDEQISSSYFTIVLSKTWNISSAAATSRSFTRALKRSLGDILQSLFNQVVWEQEHALYSVSFSFSSEATEVGPEVGKSTMLDILNLCCHLLDKWGNALNV